MNENLKSVNIVEQQSVSVNLLDGAKGEFKDIVRDVEDQYKVAADLKQDLDERIEAYEDIIDSEIGDSSLVRARNIERMTGLRQIYLKFEGSNPTGTQKDRIAFAQAMDALRRGFEAITIATCGNYGVAVALAASMAGLKCVVFIPKSFHTNRIHEMAELGAEIIRSNADYEGAVENSRSYALKHDIYDANPGGDNTMLQFKAYGEMAYEIYDDLRDAPSVIAVPVSNGTTIAGIYKGCLSLYRRGKISRMPRMVAGSSFMKNPIVQSYLKNKDTCEDLTPEQIRETPVNEPLINWRSIDGDYALWAIRETQGWAFNASDKNMKYYSKMLREKEGLHVLPASTAGLIALIEKHQGDPLPNDRYVVILTGRKA